MNNILYAFTVSLLAGLSTLIGFIFIFLKVKKIDRFIAISLSFSAIVMILISIFDLIPESFFYLQVKYGIKGILISIVSFIFGLLLIKCSNKILNKMKKNGSSLYKLGIMSAIVLMLHNIPEGIITFLTSGVDKNLGIKIAVAIMLHNIPEGICIAVPIYYSTYSIKKAFKTTIISGLSEPLGALLAFLFLYRFFTTDLLSIILIFVAGIMISLAINEIIKESIKHSKGTNKYLYIGMALGIIFFIISIMFT